MRRSDREKPLWWKAFRVFASCSGILITLLVIGIWVNPTPVNARFYQVVAKQLPSEKTRAASPYAIEGTAQRPQRDIANLEPESQAQSVAFSSQKDELDYLTRITELMMTAVGIYTIILGVVSWKTLDSQREEFERASQGSLGKFERIRDELQLDFPMLGRIQSNFKSVLASLRSACQTLDVRDDSFGTLSEVEVQSILFYENAVTTALLLNTKGYEKELSEIYRLLGVFYGSRFYRTVEDNKFEKSKYSEYFYRAQFYFDRAIGLDPQNYTLFITAGYFSQYYDDKIVASLSKGYFEKASQIGMKFQKPLVAMAIIELEAFNDSFAALARLEKARARKHYDQDRAIPRPEYLSYLEACALCLKAQKESGTVRLDTLKEITEKLSDAAKNPNEWWGGIEEFFEYDQERYFAILDTDPHLAGEAAQSIQRLQGFVPGRH